MPAGLVLFCQQASTSVISLTGLPQPGTMIAKGVHSAPTEVLKELPREVVMVGRLMQLEPASCVWCVCFQTCSAQLPP